MQNAARNNELSVAPLAIMGRFFEFDSEGISYANVKLVVKEMQNQCSTDVYGGTGLNVWDSSMLLARYLEKKPDIVKNKTVIELGAGCGLIGIAAMVLGATEVVMTDLPYALPLMKSNVQRNAMLLRTNQKIHCQVCNWFEPPPINTLISSTISPVDGLDNFVEEVYPDVILVADCVWLSPLISPLLQTIMKYTSHPSTVLIISYQKRGKDVDKEFREGIHEMFEDVSDINTELVVNLPKPDFLHIFECHRRRKRM